MKNNRIVRLNSLLKEVVADVIRKHVRNPHISRLFTVMRAEITKDLRFADIYVSVMDDEDMKKKTIDALQSAAGFVAVQSSKQVVLRYFPALTFKLDDTVDKQMAIENILVSLQAERETRND
jgi:ribosome-binding factor A